MKAVVLHAFGPPENLGIEEVPDPEPGPGQLRIAVGIAGVNVFDTHLRAGAVPDIYPMPELPAVLGFEVGGTVDRVGPGIEEAWLGTQVVAHLGLARAGYTELAVVPETSVHRVPDGLAPKAALTMLATGRTAVVVLDFVDIGPADVVMVTAAAGGVGGLILQEVRNRGAVAVGAARGTAKVDWIRAQGAIGVDYGFPDWPQAVRAELGEREVTVALDAVGGAIGRQALELVQPGGSVVLYGWSSGEPTRLTEADILGRGLTVSAAFGPRIAMRRPDGVRDFEREALKLAASGRIVAEVRRLPMSEIVAAHRLLEARETIGKLVLDVGAYGLSATPSGVR
jgi:NADPH:quinone reductase